MFYLIGLGLGLESISVEALEAVHKADKVYLEAYTVEFPYSFEKLAGGLGKKIFPITRQLVEAEDFVAEARKKDIALLVYGSPLMATTHISLILKCKEEEIDFRVYNNASIFDAVSETGLQIYKFGKTASMPRWEENYKPRSFTEIIKFNQAIKAHTLILVDMGLIFPEALRQLGRAGRGKLKLKKIIVCSRMGTEDRRFYYSDIDNLFGAEVMPLFCFIIPADLHFLEEEALKKLAEKLD